MHHVDQRNADHEDVQDDEVKVSDYQEVGVV